MKKLILLLTFLIPLQTFTQDYKLFNANSKKLFIAEPEPFTSFSLSIESAIQVGGDSVYYNFFDLDTDWYESDTCEFWGGNDCQKQNLPGWLGEKIIFNNNDNYTFFNGFGDSLIINFKPSPSDTLAFYSDNVQNFSMVFVKEDTFSVLDIIDTLRFFRLIHNDFNGNPIESDLHNKFVIIGKTLGLIQFFVIKSFPQVLRLVKLIGQNPPESGITKLTYEMMFDHQPGDETQFSEYRQYWDGPPWYSYTLYRKWKYLERLETEDSLIYQVEQHVFYKDSVGEETDTIFLKYLKSQTIAEIPLEKFDGWHRHFFKLSYCDVPFWTYQTESIETIFYCPEDTCWGHGDAGHPPEEYFKTWVCGLGIFEDRTHVEGPYYSFWDKIIYFKKGELVCGEEVGRKLKCRGGEILPKECLTAELPTSSSRTTCANRAALHPEIKVQSYK